MKQWEYKVVYVTDERSCKPVNLGELGKQGWEMCGIVSFDEGSVINMYFKREITSNNDQT